VAISPPPPIHLASLAEVVTIDVTLTTAHPTDYWQKLPSWRATNKLSSELGGKGARPQIKGAIAYMPLMLPTTT
jgi:hypothetical protein